MQRLALGARLRRRGAKWLGIDAAIGDVQLLGPGAVLQIELAVEFRDADDEIGARDLVQEALRGCGRDRRHGR